MVQICTGRVKVDFPSMPIGNSVFEYLVWTK